MMKRLNCLCGVAIVGISLVSANPVRAQDYFETWTPGGVDQLWTNDDNWTDGAGNLTSAPSIVFDSGALLNNGTAIIDDDVDAAGVVQTGGTIEIQSGSLVSEGTGLQSGVTNFNGNVLISGGAKLTGPDITVGGSGVIHLLAADSEFEAKGNLSLSGTVQLPISSAGTPNMKVGGIADLNGTVSPTFDGVTPAFGDSWEFLSGADSVVIGRGASVALPESIVLERGTEARLEATGGSASIAIGNLPILQLDRVTGAGKILNVVGGDLTFTGYMIGSERGLLDKDGFTSSGTEGFVVPTPTETTLAELSLERELTVAVGGEVDLGKAYSGGSTAPTSEDVTFQVSTPSGAVLTGLVEYLGPANDLVLNANPQTGEVTVQHLSSFIEPVEVTGYEVISPSGSLVVDNWTSFSDTGLAGSGWTEATPQPTSIAELNLGESKVFTNGTVISLGNIFDPSGDMDLQLQYTTVDEFLVGTVEYKTGGLVMVPGDCNGDGVVNAADLSCVATMEERDVVLGTLNTLPGDLDGNGDVAFADFLVLSANFGDQTKTLYTEGNIDLMGGVAFPDFLALSANFGKTPAAGSATAAVPEPSCLVLFGLGLVSVIGHRRRWRSHNVTSNANPSTTFYAGGPRS